MTAAETAQKLELECICPGDGEREISGGYTGDLLSWVMGRAPTNSAWITIMSNVNVAAVAVLADIAMIILAEGVRPDADLKKRAELENLAVYTSPLGAYELSWKLHNIMSTL